MEAIPAKDFQFALYLQHLADTSTSKTAVDEACNALAWVHFTTGLALLTSSPFACATRDGLQRSLARPGVKKSPVTVKMLTVMVRDVQCSGTLADLRLATTYLLAFTGFLRFNKLVGLRPCDIVFHQDRATVHTDQLQKGDEVVIARMGNPTYPVAILEAYMRRTSMHWEEQWLPFRPICTCSSKVGESLRESGSIIYTCLKQLGYNPEEYGLIACVLVVLLQQLMLGYQTVTSRGMEGGNLRVQRTVSWETHYKVGWMFPSSLACQHGGYNIVLFVTLVCCFVFTKKA